jgi:hypothetical protein
MAGVRRGDEETTAVVGLNLCAFFVFFVSLW